MPHAKVVQGDALEIIRLMSFDVLMWNLPNAVTGSLLRLIPELTFRAAVLAVGESTDLDQLEPRFSWAEVAQDYRGRLRTPAAQRLANRSGGSCRQRILAYPLNYQARCSALPGLVLLALVLRLSGLPCSFVFCIAVAL